MTRLSVLRMVAALPIVFGAIVPASAQEIVWSQTLNLPKGLNLPDGASVDVLGISVGDSYETVRARLEAIRAETPDAPAIEEVEQQLFYNGGGGVISARYVGELRLTRTAPQTTRTEERIVVRFSAPASGSQVIAIERSLDADDQAEQMRVGQLVEALTAKFGGAPDVMERGYLYRYQFDNGARTTAEGRYDCYDFAKTWKAENELSIINSNTGACDVLYEVWTGQGISEDHTAGVTFSIYDNERAKANLAADYAQFNAFVTEYQSSVGRAAPAL